MTARLALTLTFLLCAPAISAAPGRIARDGAEVRAQPGFAGAPLATPKGGEPVEVLDAQNEWRRVRLADGREGWVHELYVAGEVAPAARVVSEDDDAVGMPGHAFTIELDDVHASPVSDDVARGEAHAAEVALRVELMTARHRAETAERELDRLQERMEALQRERDAAQAKASVLEAREQARREQQSVPEDLLAQVKEEATREADERCAQDMGLAIENAVSDAVRHATRPEATQAVVDRAVEAQRRTLELEHALAMQSKDADCARQVAAARESPEAARESSPEAARVPQLEADLQAERDARAADVARLEAEHQKLFDTYVEIVTKRHEDALARDRAASDEECRQRIFAERQEADRVLRAARKESGWEREFETELRARTKLAVEEAQARFEAKRRGEEYDEARVRREEEARVRHLCEGERLAAVAAAVASAHADTERRVRHEREEADLRCQLALEIVLERASQGGDLTSIREFARKRMEGGATSSQPEPAPAPATQP